MGVCAADAERADAGPSRGFTFPFAGVSVDNEGAILESKLRIWLLKIQSRWENSMANDVGGIDEPGYAGSDVQMADVRLGCPEYTELLFRCAGAEGLRERRDFDGIAERGGRAMGFNVADTARIDSRHFLGHGYDSRLTFYAWSGVADLRGAVIVQSKAAD